MAFDSLVFCAFSLERVAISVRADVLCVDEIGLELGSV
jgi:hypothetical protein